VTLLQSVDDFGGGGKAAGAVARVDQRTVCADIEDAGRAFDERRFDAERALDFGSQTGGLRQIVSGRAVGVRDLHDS